MSCANVYTVVLSMIGLMLSAAAATNFEAKQQKLMITQQRMRLSRLVLTASERELAFVPPWGRGEMKKHFCAAGPFSQDSGPGAPEKHGVGRSHKRARWEPAWGRLGSPRFPVEFPRKLRMGNRRSKMGLAQRFLMQFDRFGTNENFCKNNMNF